MRNPTTTISIGKRHRADHFDGAVTMLMSGPDIVVPNLQVGWGRGGGEAGRGRMLSR